MASVDTHSVRKEVQRIKAEFEILKKKLDVSSEVSLLMHSLLTMIELMMAIFLERKTKKDAKNSSIPPSQTDKDETSPSKVGSNNKGHNDNRKLADNTRTVEIVTIASVNACDSCGENLSKITATGYERRTKMDIVFEKQLSISMLR